MKIYSFKKDTSKHITAFESNFSLTRILNHDGHAHIHFAYVPPGGVIGKHEAVVSQLFLVIEGSGMVSGTDDEQVSIHAGQAVYWEKGENHATCTEEGLKAIIIEAENMAESVQMSLLEMIR